MVRIKFIDQKYKIFVVFTIFILISFVTAAQPENYVDSLKARIQVPDNRSNIARYNEIAWALRSLNPKESCEYSDKAISLSKKYNDFVGLSRSYSYAGIAKRNLGLYVDALGYYKLGLDVCVKNRLKEQAGYAHINFGNWYISSQDFQKAFSHLNIASNIAENIDNDKMKAYCKLNLGRAYLMIRNPAKALPLFEESLRIRNLLNDKHGKASCYKNIGDVYLSKSKYDEAKLYYDSALVVVDKVLDKDLLSEIYNQLSLVSITEKKYDKALSFADLSLVAAKITGNISIISTSYQTFAIIYSEKGNYKKAFEYQEIVRKYEKMLFEQSMEGKVSNVKYEADTEQAKAKLEKESLELRNQKLETQKRNTFLLALVLTIVLILIAMTVLSKLNNDKKKANILLKKQSDEIQEKNRELHIQNDEINAQKNEIERQKSIVEHHRDEIQEINNELQSQNEEINAQKDEIEKQKLLVEKQRDQILVQQENMKDSIIYARRIQQAMLTPKLYIDKILPENFISYLPRDIVSGDFYWIREVENKTIVIAGDCTGHGVPGAFVSMLGMSFLNEIITKKKITKANEILEELRSNIKRSLRQTLTSDDSQDDGIDMALCVIDKQNNLLEFAGANNPLFLIRNNELTIYKGTINPVGIYFREIPFSSESIDIEKGDILYMFSDGYIDQFGGPDNRRFMTTRFKELLLENHLLPMKKQKFRLEDRLAEWQGDYKRVDDILVIGIKI